MAVTLSRGKSDQQLHHLQKLKEKEDHHHHQQLQNITNDHHQQSQKRVVVPVVYYLSRNGHLEHPHFMEVPLSSSSNGLFLRDVILRLNLLRGKSMASHYSWSSKRSYKNGFVWHDLSEDDFIHPVHGGDYVLKGSEISTENLISSSSIVNSKYSETTSSSSNNTVDSVSEIPRKNHNYSRRRNQSWGAVDLHEYKVYKSESTHDFAGKAAADASTQTEEKRRRNNNNNKKKPTIIEEENDDVGKEQSTELSTEEISPPPSDSSPETLETLMKSDGRLLTLKGDHLNNPNFNPTVGSCPSGRFKASSVLMSLISCGSLSFRDCGVAAVKDHGFSMMSNYKNRVPRGGNQTVEGGNSSNNEMMMMEMESNVSSSFAKMALEDKEYFSGSLIETKNKQEIPTILKRSSSYNADRSLHLKLEEKEDGVRAKCIPRRLKSQTSTSKKDSDAESTRVSINSTQERSQD